MAEEYGVARATVHKALQELARDGLIVTRPGKRAVVTRAHLPRQVRAEGGEGIPARSRCSDGTWTGPWRRERCGWTPSASPRSRWSTRWRRS
ncbi:GntR family transcriptional regulator [Streptacidiphilus monticola]